MNRKNNALSPFHFIAIPCMLLPSCGGGMICFEYTNKILETMKELPLSCDDQRLVFAKNDQIFSASFRREKGTCVLFSEARECVYSGNEEEFRMQYGAYECASLVALDTPCPDNETFFALAEKTLGGVRFLTAKDFFPSSIRAIEPLKTMLQCAPYYYFALDKNSEGYANLIDTLRNFLPNSFVEDYQSKTAPALEFFYLGDGDRHFQLCSIEGDGSFLPKGVLPEIS